MEADAAVAQLGAAIRIGAEDDARSRRFWGALRGRGRTRRPDLRLVPLAGLSGPENARETP